VLVDTGPIVAVLNRSDQYHRVCVEALHEILGPLFTCWPVLTEAAWLLGQGAHASEHLQQLIRSVDSGFISLLSLSSEDALPIGVILKKYRHLRIQLADAALVHLAARDGLDTIFTLDRRDFLVYRLPKGRALRVLPEPR
jgi:uncharacterized protein